MQSNIQGDCPDSGFWKLKCGKNPERDVMPAKGHVTITIARCKGCGYCVEFCPTKVLALSSAFNIKGYHPPYVARPEKCSGCDLCGMYCPDFAIYATRDKVSDKESSHAR
jgi:2-oxoglutarate ferredoxin oxidoreductase subunit delta